MTQDQQQPIRSFGTWRESVDFLLQAKYCIDLNDAGWTSSELKSFWERGEQPAEFVDWFGEKFDLVTSDSWLAGRKRATGTLQ